MPNQEVVPLGVLAGRIKRLDMRCRRCLRRSRMRLTPLLAEHGPDIGLPDLAVRLAVGCPKLDSPNLGERCFVFSAAARAGQGTSEG